jgi:hypothetical protein
MMDLPLTFNEMVTWIAGLGVTGYVKSIQSRLKRAEEKLDIIPETYVRKDDYKTDIAEIKGDLKSLLNHIMGRPNGT